jgi:hypothetical protein
MYLVKCLRKSVNFSCYHPIFPLQFNWIMEDKAKQWIDSTSVSSVIKLNFKIDYNIICKKNYLPMIMVSGSAEDNITVTYW